MLSGFQMKMTDNLITYLNLFYFENVMLAKNLFLYAL